MVVAHCPSRAVQVAAFYDGRFGAGELVRAAPDLVSRYTLPDGELVLTAAEHDGERVESIVTVTAQERR
jgi:hypothetical protein